VLYEHRIKLAMGQMLVEGGRLQDNLARAVEMIAQAGQDGSGRNRLGQGTLWRDGLWLDRRGDGFASAVLHRHRHCSDAPQQGIRWPVAGLFCVRRQAAHEDKALEPGIRFAGWSPPLSATPHVGRHTV